MPKVLIVDDEEWIRLGLREQIDWNRLGLQIAAEAQNGAAAWDMIEKDPPDIVITDIRMPVMDGIKLMEKLHQHHPEIIVIVISGYSEFEYARKALTFCAVDYILKPIEEEQLEESLNRALAKISEKEKGRGILLKAWSHFNEMNPFLREKLFESLLSDSGTETEIIKKDQEKAFFYYLESIYRQPVHEMIEVLFRDVASKEQVKPENVRNMVLELALGMDKLLKRYGSRLKELLGENYQVSFIMKSDIFSREELKKWLEEISDKVMDFIAGTRKSSTRKTMDEVELYLQEHYCEQVSLNSVADLFYFNPAYLSRAFKSETGKNFNDYLTELRMSRALELLSNPELRMNDISEMVGYENVNYFLKKFKEHFGCTPTEIKRNQGSQVKKV